jgi:uncharacterized RDD family membrane protein YckC
MSQLVINTSFNIELGFELAPLHKRMIAYVLDGFIMFAYIYIVFFILGTSIDGVFDNDSKYSMIFIFILLTPVIFYHLLSEILMNGESIGKKVMGIRIISLDGNAPTMSQYALRWFLRAIDFSFTSLMGGLICAAITKNGQRIGDLAAGTTVVSKKLPYSIDQTIFKPISAETYKVSYPQVMRLSDRDINTINNIILQHNKSRMHQYVDTIAEKVKTVLEIETTEEPILFLETLLNDYNYLSQKQ